MDEYHPDYDHTLFQDSPEYRVWYQKRKERNNFVRKGKERKQARLAKVCADFQESKSFEVSKREMLWVQAGKACFYCRVPLPFDKMTIDHYFPQSLFAEARKMGNLAVTGVNDINNLRCSCSTCNTRKGSLLPHHFRVNE